MLFLPKRLFSILGEAHNETIFVDIGPKKTIFKRFYQLFFRTIGLQHKLLTSIEPPSIFHWKSAKKSKVAVALGQNLGKLGPNVVKNKETGISMGFFFIFCMRYIRSGYGNR